MKSVLISIQPKWVEKIANGQKTIEVRKTRPKLETPFKCYIYQTKKPVHTSFSGIGRHISEYDKTCYYNERSGNVIGEFICDRIQSYECEFVDDDCYEEIANIFVDEDGDETGFIEWSNDSGLPYEKIDLHKESCIQYNELKKYMGLGFGTFYGWHISNLVIYEHPKELSEFGTVCEGLKPYQCDNCEYSYTESNESIGVYHECCCDNIKPLKRPPQSWCYVEKVNPQ